MNDLVHTHKVACIGREGRIREELEEVDEDDQNTPHEILKELKKN